MSQTTQKFKPPLKNGITASRIYLSQGNGLLLDFLCAHFPHIDRTQWQNRMSAGEVFNAAGTPQHANSPGIAHSEVFYYRELPAERHIPFYERILYQDAHLLVVDKPHFLPVTPAGDYLQETLLTRLRNHTGIVDLSPIHRLDKDTAGVMLFSTQAASRAVYQGLFRQNAVHKTYLAVAPTNFNLAYPHQRSSRIIERPEQFFLTMETHGSPNSHSTITLLAQHGAHSLYQLEPRTGKKHQLRLHMSALGMPIINDVFYPTPAPVQAADFSKPLQLLAHKLAFTDPISGACHQFISEQTLMYTPPK